jgi:hypothetical protein
MQMHPHIDLADSIVRIFGIPGILAGLIWLVRTYDKGAHQMKEIHADTVETRRMTLETLGGVNTIQTNHLVHLQDGITRLAGSNDEAVTVLHDIKAGIGILVDRTPRA